MPGRPLLAASVTLLNFLLQQTYLANSANVLPIRSTPKKVNRWASVSSKDKNFAIITDLRCLFRRFHWEKSCNISTGDTLHYHFYCTLFYWKRSRHMIWKRCIISTALKQFNGKIAIRHCLSHTLLIAPNFTNSWKRSDKAIKRVKFRIVNNLIVALQLGYACPLLLPFSIYAVIVLKCSYSMLSIMQFWTSYTYFLFYH